MVWQHRRTKIFYRLLMDAFDVHRQCRCIVYISLDTGEVFVKDESDFYDKFSFVKDAQAHIQPRELNEELPIGA